MKSKSNNKTLIAVIVISALAGLSFVGYKVWQHQRRKSGNEQKDSRKIIFTKRN